MAFYHTDLHTRYFHCTKTSFLLPITFLLLIVTTVFFFSELRDYYSTNEEYTASANAVQPLNNITARQTMRATNETTERKVRQTENLATSTGVTANATNHKNFYYEEQNPVVVHAESKPSYDYQQTAQTPPAQIDSQDIDPFYADESYFAPEYRLGAGAEQENYDDHDWAQAQQSDYPEPVRETNTEGRATQQRNYDGYYRGGEVVAGGRTDGVGGWHYATPQQSQKPLTLAQTQNNRRPLEPNVDGGGGFAPNAGGHQKLPLVPGYYRDRDTVDIYDEPDRDNYEVDYDALQRKQKQKQTTLQQQQRRQQFRQRPPMMPQYRQRFSSPEYMQAKQRNPDAQTTTTTTATSTLPAESTQSENSLISVLRTLKTMWDIYNAISAAWSAMSDRSKKPATSQGLSLKQQQKLQLQQIQSRINSRKPPKFDPNSNDSSESDKSDGSDETEVANNNNNNNSNKSKNNNKNTANNNKNKLARTTAAPNSASATKTPIRTTTTTTTTEGPPAKVEPRKAGKHVRKNVDTTALAVREKRGSNNKAADVGEGRYIKGDPLKGYYDFIITEGSYKFWAIFQLGTAILIIYSTFAAIYYSKVNPLVSDYDYTDYLGGARSLAGGDEDFVDDTEDNVKSSVAAQSATPWYQEFLPKAGQSLQFILNAIDKLPADESSNKNHQNEVATDIEEFVPMQKKENFKDTYENADEIETNTNAIYSDEQEQLNLDKIDAENEHAASGEVDDMELNGDDIIEV